MILTPFAKTAQVWAAESTCAKKQVGAVIFNKKTKHLLSIGYNGTIAGAIHCTEFFDKAKYTIDADLLLYIPEAKDVRHPAYNCSLECLEKNNQYDYQRDHGYHKGWYISKEDWNMLHHKFAEKYEVHAEQNAVYNMLKLGTDLKHIDELVLLSTLEPCDQCLKLIAGIGIREVYYLTPYHNESASSRLGVLCTMVDVDESIQS